jgi:hypothetical protein
VSLVEVVSEWALAEERLYRALHIAASRGIALNETEVVWKVIGDGWTRGILAICLTESCGRQSVSATGAVAGKWLLVSRSASIAGSEGMYGEFDAVELERARLTTAARCDVEACRCRGPIGAIIRELRIDIGLE